MAADSDTEMKILKSDTITVEIYRKYVQTYLNMHIYNAALFWADKVVALTEGNPRDVYWMAQCMYLLKQYHRAAHLLRSKNLDKTFILCNYLTVRCLLEANELNEALKVANAIDTDMFIENSSGVSNASSFSEGYLFDDIPRHHVHAAYMLLKGKLLEAMDNRGLAADCYKQAIKSDAYCYDAFDTLINHQMLTAAEEKQLLDSIPVSNLSSEESEILLYLYSNQLKKYHAQYDIIPSSNKKKLSDTDNTSDDKNESDEEEMVVNDQKEQLKSDKIGISENIWSRLHTSLDVAVSQAEKLYYSCEYQECSTLTQNILKQDPYHSACLPIYISCQVELKQSNKLFSLAHNLVDLYPNLAISWFAVGCYYYVIGKSDSARRYLAKATCLDRLFGPAWLAYGHSFAVENEHDQAMAAYFKASQLMKGCHLPLLYIGLECGLTNNVKLAEKFFEQAKSIAPDDPFVMHEMGTIAFQNANYYMAEKYFNSALERVKKNKNTMLPQRWESLLNNLGHTSRKLKKYKESLEYHKQALILSPQAAGTYSAIAYVYALMGKIDDAIDWFHKALGLRRDDTFSTTMLNYVIEQLSDQPPYLGAPEGIPNFNIETKTVTSTFQHIFSEDSEISLSKSGENNETSMSIEIDMPEASSDLSKN